MNKMTDKPNYFCWVQSNQFLPFPESEWYFLQCFVIVSDQCTITEKKKTMQDHFVTKGITFYSCSQSMPRLFCYPHSYIRFEQYTTSYVIGCWNTYIHILFQYQIITSTSINTSYYFEINSITYLPIFSKDSKVLKVL